jgi:prepilin-type N-terminal cleavage/methylation domain-containing protein
VFKAINEKGFTLVELLVVVVIIAVLAAIAVPIFLNQKTKAQNSADQATVSAIANALNTGMSTGGTIVSYSAGGNLVVSDGTGVDATITVPTGAAIVANAANATPVNKTAGALSGSSTFCVSLGGYSMSNGETKPTTTVPSCDL